MVYVNKPRQLDALKTNVVPVIHDMSQPFLQRMTQNCYDRMEQAETAICIKSSLTINAMD